ncbi:MAG: monovalent cation/H+ antiporter complex subunit F [Acidimicrobiales bacterium]
MIAGALSLLGLAVLCFGYRTLAGPTLADRMIGVSGMLTAGMAGVVVQAVDSGNGAFLPVVLVVSLVGFVGTGMVARFIERQGG